MMRFCSVKLKSQVIVSEICSELSSFWFLKGQTVTRLPSGQEERWLHVSSFLWGQRKGKGPVLRVKGRPFAQETMRTLLINSYVEAVPAPGWRFFHGRVWMFLYLGQDFCAKTHLMNKPLVLPSKPVSSHNRFLQTGKQYFCDSLFVICLFFLCLLLLPSFHGGAMWPLAAGSHMPGSAHRAFHVRNGSPST